MFNNIFYFIFYRLLFTIKYKTFRSIILLNSDEIIVSCSKGIFQMNRRCPHQGAHLEHAYKKDNILICHWHGCNIFVDKKGVKL